jgi:preprotein translocase subunit YajC
MSAFVTSIVPFVLIMGIFYLLVLVPERRRRKKLQELIGSLKIGDKVVTTGGIYGTVIGVRETTLVVRSDQSKLEIARNSVVGLQGETSETQAVAAQ